VPLTVAGALKEIEVLSRARVVAGHGGLNRRIQWAHVVDIPDVANWVREGDLLLTTAYALKDNQPAQLELVPSLVAKGLAGMIVAVGRYFQELPTEAIQAANELDFPIITLPFEVPFVEVTQAIHRYVLGEQYRLLEQSLRIHKVLTQVVLEGKGLESLAESLAKLLGLSVTIEDASLRLLAYASDGPVDEMRMRSIAEGRTPAEEVNRLLSQELFDHLRRDPRPRRLPPAPEVGATLERIICPITVGRQLYGYVWIITADRHLTELDFQAIESAAVVAALIITRQQAIHDAEQRLKNSLLDNLLDPDPYHALQDLTQTLRNLGLHQGYQVLVVEGSDGRGVAPNGLYRMVEEKLRSEGLRATTVERGQRLIILLGSTETGQGSEVANSLLEQAAREGIPLTIGLSGAGRQASHVRQCYQDALEALRIGKALAAGQSRVWAFEELGFLHWLRALPPDLYSNSRYHRVVREIAEQDQRRGTEYLKTLETYLDQLGNAQEASERLYIHRNTLRQRLSRIEEDWSLNLQDPHTLLNLLISIKDWRINRSS